MPKKTWRKEGRGWENGVWVGRREKEREKTILTIQERKWKPMCQKLQVGEKRNGKKGERVCCLSSIHVTFFTRVEEGGLGFQGHRMLLRSEILDIPSVTLSAGGQVFQTGRLRAARGGCRNTWKNQSGCPTKRRYCNVPQLVNSLWCRVKGCWSLQWWVLVEIMVHMQLSTDTKKLKALCWKAPSWHLTQNLLVEVTPGSSEPGFNWEINPCPKKSQQWQPVN